MLSEISREGAQVFANRLREKIAAQVFSNDTFSVNLTASLGIAVANPTKVPIDARALVRCADKALYSAKENGRNRVEFFEFEG